MQNQLISQLSGTIENKSVFVSVRGLTSTQWSEYSDNTKRVQYSSVPTRTITAESVTVDGFVLSQKDTAGITIPLAIQKGGSCYSAPARLAKQGFRSQVCSRLGGGLDKPRSEFAPQGRADNGVSASQPSQWSSEYNDSELGLIYYNYRHYNPMDGRWMGRDCLNIPTIPAYRKQKIK